MFLPTLGFRSLLADLPWVSSSEHKACIHLSDEKQKRRGILAMAGFLGHSDRLVMLWTTRYFTRLWCVFEVVTWLRIGRELKFVPVSSALFFILAQPCVFLYVIFGALCMCIVHVHHT